MKREDLFMFRLNKLASISGQPLNRLCEGQYGITRREWRLIVVLAQDGPLVSGDLAERARIEPVRTSRTVTVMVESGLAVRVPRARDRRYVEIHLTERARKIFDSLYPEVVRLNTQLLAGLSEEDLAHLDRLLEHLERVAPSLGNLSQLPKADRRRQHR